MSTEQQAKIDNPIINSPFTVPKQHFKFDENGITDQVISGRRANVLYEYFSHSEPRPGVVPFITLPHNNSAGLRCEKL